MSKSMATLFHCPVCAAKYELSDLKPRQGRRPRVMWCAFAAAVHSTAARANSFSNTSLLNAQNGALDSNPTRLFGLQFLLNAHVVA